MIADHCEAKLHGFRRTADGVVVSFVIHPQQIPQALALDPLGTRYMVAFAQIGDDERPLPSPGAGAEPATEHTARTDASRGRTAGSIPATGAKERYAAMSAGEQAVVRAAMLPKDERFRAWVARQFGGRQISEEDAEVYIRHHCCKRCSRKLIAEVPEYLDRFLAMETEFKMDVGEMARPR